MYHLSGLFWRDDTVNKSVSDKIGSVFSCIWGKCLVIVLCFTFYLPGFWKYHDCYTISSWRTPIVWAALFLTPPTPIRGTVTSRRINSQYDTWGSHSSVAEDSSCLGHALSTGTQLLTYQTIIVPTYSWSSSSKTHSLKHGNCWPVSIAQYPKRLESSKYTHIHHKKIKVYVAQVYYCLK